MTATTFYTNKENPTKYAESVYINVRRAPALRFNGRIKAMWNMWGTVKAVSTKLITLCVTAMLPFSQIELKIPLRKTLGCCIYFCSTDRSICNHHSQRSVILELFSVKMPSSCWQERSSFWEIESKIIASGCHLESRKANTYRYRNGKRKAKKEQCQKSKKHIILAVKNLLSRCCRTWLCCLSILIASYASCLGQRSYGDVSRWFLELDINVN